MNLRKTARGQQCLVRIPGVCNHDPETVVLAHLNGGGTGMKHSDLKGAFCCSACHDCLDRRAWSDYSRDDLRLMHLEGVMRTQQWWLDHGYIKCEKPE